MRASLNYTFYFEFSLDGKVKNMGYLLIQLLEYITLSDTFNRTKIAEVEFENVVISITELKSVI